MMCGYGVVCVCWGRCVGYMRERERERKASRSCMFWKDLQKLAHLLALLVFGLCALNLLGAPQLLSDLVSVIVVCILSNSSLLYSPL